LIAVDKSSPQWQVLQDPEEQLPQAAPLLEEAEVNLYPTLAAQELISFCTFFPWQEGQSTSGSFPKTSFSNSLPQS
jgi:hypothetical protein